MQDGPTISAASSAGQWDRAKNVARGVAASREAGVPCGGVFAADGRMGIKLGQARGLDSEEELVQSAGDGETPRKRKS